MDRLVALAVSRRYLMVGLFVAVLVGGLIAFKQLNIEAYPDPTPPMVDIVTQSPGLSSEEIERYITIPIETQVAGIKNLRTIRTISLYGLSDVKLQFSFDYTYDEALQQVLNRLSQLAPLPGNVLPGISPLSPIGEIYRYRLTGPPQYSVLDLKTLQDWVLQRRFRAVPGVVDVTGWGGKTKTYELQVDFNKLIAYGLTLPQVLQAVSNANINVGGNTVNIGAQSAVVRGVGLIRSIDDLASTMVSQSGGNPVLDKDVAIVATDLNQAMLDEAASIGTARPVEWQQADAMQLPFEDESFDAVVCQFGVMFFPDKSKAFAQARRVLRPGGVFIFNVWDRIAENEFADVVQTTLDSIFPKDPPRFMTRTPHGYHDIDAIKRDLANGGFAATPVIETVAARSRAPSAHIAAMAYCQGSPWRTEIEARGSPGLGEATAAAAEAIAVRFGREAIEGKIQAHVVTVTR